MNNGHYLYQCFDVNKNALFIGEARTLAKIEKEHANKSWWNLVNEISTEICEDKDIADIKCQSLLETKKPWFNDFVEDTPVEIKTLVFATSFVRISEIDKFNVAVEFDRYGGLFNKEVLLKALSDSSVKLDEKGMPVSQTLDGEFILTVKTGVDKLVKFTDKFKPETEYLKQYIRREENIDQEFEDYLDELFDRVLSNGKE